MIRWRYVLIPNGVKLIFQFMQTLTSVISSRWRVSSRKQVVLYTMGDDIRAGLV